MATPHVLSWDNPTVNIDGTTFDPTTQAGINIVLDSEAAVSVPLASGTSFDMASLAAYEALKSGAHTVGIELVTVGGTTSALSNVASFSIVATPMAPTSLKIS